VRKPASAGATAEIRPEFQTSYGPYSRAAQAELERDGEEPAPAPVRAANSNTTPSARKPEPPATEAAPVLETVVPFNGPRVRATVRSPLAYAEPMSPPPVVPATVALRPPEGQLATVVESSPAAKTGDKIDVVLSRETATVTLPAGEAMLPEGLIGRLGRALAEAQSQEIESVAEIKALEHASAAGTLPAAPESPGDDYLSMLEAATRLDADLDKDPGTADAIPMAGRLRPAIPAE
jgi:hypothetical protein